LEVEFVLFIWGWFHCNGILNQIDFFVYFLHISNSNHGTFTGKNRKFCIFSKEIPIYFSKLLNYSPKFERKNGENTFSMIFPSVVKIWLDYKTVWVHTNDAHLDSSLITKKIINIVPHEILPHPRLGKMRLLFVTFFMYLRCHVCKKNEKSPFWGSYPAPLRCFYTCDIGW